VTARMMPGGREILIDMSQSFPTAAAVQTGPSIVARFSK
jgi:hypothetical protein